MEGKGSLGGKVAIVTGSSKGIGRAIAKRLGRDGAGVVVNYCSSKKEAMELVSQLKDGGTDAIAVQADVSRVDDIRRLFDQAIEHFHRLDILVHNPALFQPKPMAQVTEEEFDTAFSLNAKGTFFALKEAASKMEQGGRIVYVSSCSTSGSFPGFSVYVGSKAAGEQFARTLAQEVGDRGITVNIVSPGFTETDMLPKDPAWRKMGADMSPFKRLGKPEEVANVVAFLVSKEAGWITGENIRASGGVGT